MEINFMCCVSDSSHFFKVLQRDQKPLVILILLLRILDLLKILYPQHVFSNLEMNLFSVNFLCINHLFLFICREAKSSLIYVAGYSY